ncbi:GntR family transcriptional regulator [Amycolatopsis sp. FDAARGOS 1241]|uniref:GntR family transcriptional regulator n=1 Tax=Amycolatopsis sp. FDAARGOS 1241 TaxID=2778070 RepID=UPI00194F2F1F|nr:GntR family transcriptional regulator [Amycolatopsis sp. FDAARGOS 1241]QRP44361.1 GntR family transcriptional regulator [Amycolatopsis sp. FDAARGOS 1241]
MILDVDLTSEVPIYQQIRDRVVEGIAAGDLADGDPLPSTRQLAVDLGINFHTVNKAYDQLRREGLLLITRKSGAVVQRVSTADFAAGWRGRLKTLLAEAVAHGLDEREVLAHCEETVRAFEEVRA